MSGIEFNFEDKNPVIVKEEKTGEEIVVNMDPGFIPVVVKEDGKKVVKNAFFGMPRKEFEKIRKERKLDVKNTPSFDEVPPGQGPGREWEK